MTITAPPREPARRKQDVLGRLETELDVWVATADADGTPCLVALWFLWDGRDVWMSTRPGNPTGRNLRAGGRTRLAFGDTRDVVLIDGAVAAYASAGVPPAAAEAFAAKTGWDPRRGGAAYDWFWVRPCAVQAWHGVPELRGRHLMRDGVWTV
ncbi:pyridoxamine 5'-phosphate oxidase family protein [Streptomyces sp. NPDC003717]|uniref:pyridoxamine 5'-phosphate oxidase family protein n=1 Tax=Streptomyces sp. NPDC003717 TaxID=3154276 RepID=UPI0033AEF9AC